MSPITVILAVHLVGAVIILRSLARGSSASPPTARARPHRGPSRHARRDRRSVRLRRLLSVTVLTLVTAVAAPVMIGTAHAAPGEAGATEGEEVSPQHAVELAEKYLESKKQFGTDSAQYNHAEHWLEKQRQRAQAAAEVDTDTEADTEAAADAGQEASEVPAETEASNEAEAEQGVADDPPTDPRFPDSDINLVHDPTGESAPESTTEPDSEPADSAGTDQAGEPPTDDEQEQWDNNADPEKSWEDDDQPAETDWCANGVGGGPGLSGDRLAACRTMAEKTDWGAESWNHLHRIIEQQGGWDEPDVQQQVNRTIDHLSEYGATPEDVKPRPMVPYTESPEASSDDDPAATRTGGVGYGAGVGRISYQPSGEQSGEQSGGAASVPADASSAEPAPDDPILRVQQRQREHAEALAWERLQSHRDAYADDHSPENRARLSRAQARYLDASADVVNSGDPVPDDRAEEFRADWVETQERQREQAEEANERQNYPDGITLNADQIARVVEDVGLPCVTGTAVALAESDGDTNINSTIPGEDSRGLFQINEVHGFDFNWDDAHANAEKAKDIYDAAGGWEPWGAYTDGPYDNFVPEAKAACG